jgi:hypothetical protein
VTVKELNTKMQDFIDQLEDHIVAAVKANDKDIVELNREQMQIGQNAKGEKIGFLRSLSYAQAKIDQGGMAPFRVPDLLNTGAFQSRMFLEVQSDEYFIGSTDSKEPDLVDKYGKIFGLVPEQQQAAKELTTKSLSKIFTQQTGVKG